MFASRSLPHPARRLHGDTLRRPPVTGGVTSDWGSPVKTREGKAGGVEPAAARIADPEAAAVGAHQGAAAVCVFPPSLKWNSGGGTFDEQLYISNLSSGIRLR